MLSVAPEVRLARPSGVVVLGHADKLRAAVAITATWPAAMFGALLGNSPSPHDRGQRHNDVPVGVRHRVLHVPRTDLGGEGWRSPSRRLKLPRSSKARTLGSSVQARGPSPAAVRRTRGGVKIKTTWILTVSALLVTAAANAAPAAATAWAPPYRWQQPGTAPVMTAFAQPAGLKLYPAVVQRPVIARTGYHWAQPGTAAVENPSAQPAARIVTP